MLRDLVRLVDVTGWQKEATRDLVLEKWEILQKWKYAIDDNNGEEYLRGVNWRDLDLDDLWVLVDTELEMKRKGNFERLFPSLDAVDILPYMSQNRNILVMDWINRRLSIDDIQ